MARPLVTELTAQAAEGLFNIGAEESLDLTELERT